MIYCTPTYRRFDLCERSIDAVMGGSWQPESVFVIDDSGTFAGRQLHNNLSAKYPNIDFMFHSERRGVAQSWNDFFNHTTDDLVMIANDDIEVHHYSIENLMKAAHENPQHSFFAGAGYSGNAFSLFLMRRSLWKELGGFDERFFPAYFEDNDFYRRMKLAGYKIITVDSAPYNHAVSATLHSYTSEEMNLHHQQFRENRSYYIYKWGGLPEEETYEKPFNGAG